MNDRAESEAAESMPRWVRSLPFLSAFHTPLPILGEPGEGDLDATFHRLGELLGAAAAPLVVRIQLAGTSGTRSWVLSSGPAGCEVTNDTAQPINAEVILDADTWMLIAGGRLSVLEAFAQGRMRARGDMRSAVRVAKQLYRQDAQDSSEWS